MVKVLVEESVDLSEQLRSGDGILPSEFDYDVEFSLIRKSADQSSSSSGPIFRLRPVELNPTQPAPDVLPTGRTSSAAGQAVGRNRTRRQT